MSSTRQDAWTHDEDLLLAEIVLRHIREGGTQLQAFEEVGKQMNRTAAACGFRWNSYVRKQYKSGIELAKKQRKERKFKAVEKLEEVPLPKVSETVQEISETKGNDELTLSQVVSYLQNLLTAEKEASVLEEHNANLQQEKEKWEKSYKDLKLHFEIQKEEYENLKKEYNSLLSFFEKARQLAGK
ncbi:RsfA family transcriptional regulator [Heyndrickxia acidicola]|uniref:RsfA family transcriptional regulator n=1 Tax=Heyndrickxia acidicola TaxID=209389 RepID=A0ABU6MBX5_9BACI|nr:RsfA family transcriptional regulator [Heyndrickxia acidicola]MED1202180.1 RsfA family transcriptional regulator [Heyndrickxia acidicola]